MIRKSPNVVFFFLAALCAAAQSVATPYSDAVLADNPVAYFQLNETTGAVAANSSTHGATLNGNYIGYGTAVEGTGPINIGQAGPRPGNPTGTATITGMGASNYAIHSAINFPVPPTDPPTTGENPRVEVPDFDGTPLDILGVLTLEAWFYRDPQSAGYDQNNEGIVDKYSGGGSQRSYELVHQANNGALRLIISRFGVYEGNYDIRATND